MANPIILPSRSAKRRGQADPRATAADIAQAAGVSTATVSRALQENSIVSVETREKVLAAARRLGYRPNSLARSLAAGQNSLIGVVTGDITNPFYPEVIERLTRRLTSAGLHPILVNMFDDNAFEDTLSSVLQYRVKAVIFTASPLTSTACELCEDYDVPLYLFNRHLASGDSFAVVCNNLAGGRMVAARLLDNGHSNLAYISGRPDTSTNQERHSGFAKMIAERGAAPCITEHGGVYSYEAGYKAAIRLVQAHPEVDGIFCANDILALGALDALRYELGKQVPRDISVIGFDDIAPAAWPAYNLTTIRQPVDQMIEAVVSAIQRVNVEDPLTPGSPAVLDGELVIRGSARLEPRSGQEAAHDAA